MREWGNVKHHPIVGGVYRSWERELEIKDNIEQRLQKKLKKQQNENSI